MLPKRNKYTKNMKFVLTIHDLAIKKLKTVGSLKNTIIQKMFLGKSMRIADKFIAISKATKKDIMELFGINEEKISLVYNGVNIDTSINVSEEEKKAIKEKFKIQEQPYIFFISTIEPRKNVETLIKAFEYIKNSGKSNMKLIIAGGLGWKYDEVLKLYENSKYKEDIIMLGYIEKKEKKYLFENAKCFVYPSLYEGFGLPVLEAMENKALIVTTNVSSLPEVGGDIAFYFNDVLDEKELGEKILEAINLDEDKKKVRIENGLKQVEKFDWDKCMKETLKVIKE